MPVERDQMITFPSNGGQTPGYLAVPESGPPHPGLVIIQEWWGLVPHIKDVANRFAAEGFVTLAPDLYHGKAAAEPDEARKLAMELDRDRAVLEITAAVDYLKSRAEVSPPKVGVVGWCMGGGLALAAAARPQVDAAVAFYGAPRDPQLIQEIRAPVLGLYGGHDHGIPSDRIDQIRQGLQQAGVPNEVILYPQAGHAFFNDTRPEAYDPAAAQDAWNRTITWLRQYLTEHPSPGHGEVL